MDEPRAWDVLESAYLSRKPWLTLRRDRVRLPGGAVIDEYLVLEYPAWVSVVAVTSEGRVVLVRQYRHGLGRAGVELPAGVVEPGDPSPESAARRELREETGEDPVLEWITGTALRPVKAALSDDEWTAFRNDLAPKLRAAYPRRPDGRTWFPFRRVFAVAQVS